MYLLNYVCCVINWCPFTGCMLRHISVLGNLYNYAYHKLLHYIYTMEQQNDGCTGTLVTIQIHNLGNRCIMTRMLHDHYTL